MIKESVWENHLDYKTDLTRGAASERVELRSPGDAHEDKPTSGQEQKPESESLSKDPIGLLPSHSPHLSTHIRPGEQTWAAWKFLETEAGGAPLQQVYEWLKPPNLLLMDEP